MLIFLDLKNWKRKFSILSPLYVNKLSEGQMPRIIRIIGEFHWAKIPFTKPKQANLPAKFHLEIFIINFHSTWLLYFYNRPKIPIVTSIGWLLLDFNLFQFSCYLYFNFSNCHWFWYIVLLYRFYTCISTVYL